jgi:hypothetical protein
MLRESNTIIVERNWTWSSAFKTEPNEAAWATEAIYFVRALNTSGELSGTTAQVQISPDGIHWCNEGTVIDLPAEPDQVTFARVSHFGGWLRVVGELPEGRELTVMVYLSLKA